MKYDNNRLITPELTESLNNYPLYSQTQRRRMQCASQCFTLDEGTLKIGSKANG